MKRLSITWRVTLLYTLFMVLLAGLSLGFLFHAGAQTARQEKLTRMQSMVEESRREIEAKDGELDIDRDLEAFDDGIYLSFTILPVCPCMALCPAILIIRRFFPTGNCARWKAAAAAGTCMTSKSR